MAKEVIKPENFDLYSGLIQTHPEIEIKGASMPYTSYNGNMFSFLSKEGLVGLRLPQAQREQFIRKYKTALFEANNTVLKEYVMVPAVLLKKTKELSPYLALSYEYVKTLKPKPSRKK